MCVCVRCVCIYMCGVCIYICPHMRSSPSPPVAGSGPPQPMGGWGGETEDGTICKGIIYTHTYADIQSLVRIEMNRAFL